jgi:nucleoside-diphosphate-sugar epimerase
MRVLVTGSEGYIGSVLVPFLEARGHGVIGPDVGFYTDGRLYDDSPAALKQRWPKPMESRRVLLASPLRRPVDSHESRSP